MNLRRLLAVLMAVAMLGAGSANSASASMTAEGQWYVGETAPGTLLSGSRFLSCSVTPVVLTGVVGSTPTKLEADLECPEVLISNEPSSHGMLEGRLTFSSIRVIEPYGCTVSGWVTTEPLKGELYMYSGSTFPFVKFEPREAGGLIAEVPIEGTCAIAGPRVLKGSVFGEFDYATSTPAVFQSLRFSSVVENTTESQLKFAGNAAHLSGSVVNSIGESFMEH